MTPASTNVDLENEVICFSALASLRCQGLSEQQTIAAFVPSAVEVVLVPTLLAVAWTRPRSTLILLAIELVLHPSLSVWDLLTRLSSPSTSTGSTFITSDTALAITSSLPLLFLLLFLTAHLLADIRPRLSPALRSRSATHAFVLLLAPLIPIGFVGGLLPSFLLLVYTRTSTASSVKGTREESISFATPADETLHQDLSDAGAIASATYTLFICLLTAILIFYSRRPPSTTRNAPSRPPSRPSLSSWPRTILTLAFLLASSEMALTTVPPAASSATAFQILIIRKSLRLASRVLIVVGLVGLYRPSPSPGPGGGGSSMEEGFEILPSSSVEEKRNTTTTTTSLGTRLAPRGQTAFDAEKQQIAQGKRNGKEKAKPEPLKLRIGAPVDGTFRKLDTSATREFYALHSAKIRAMGMSMGVGEDGEVPSTGAPIGRVVFRSPAARAPVLSFTSSTFDSSALEGLARAVAQPDRGPDASRSNSRQALLTSTGIAPAEPPTAVTAFSTLTRTTRGSVKKYTGSIYAPSRVSVEESELSQWPPAIAAPGRALGMGLPVGGAGFVSGGADGRGMEDTRTARGLISATMMGTIPTGQLSLPTPTPTLKPDGRTRGPTVGPPLTLHGGSISILETTLISHPYTYHSPALSRDTSTSSTQADRPRSRLSPISTHRLDEPATLKAGLAPSYRMTDALTPVNSLPRVNSVRRKPVPTFSSPKLPAVSATAATAAAEGERGMQVRQYFSSGAAVLSREVSARRKSRSARAAYVATLDSEKASTDVAAPPRSLPPVPIRKSTDPALALSSPPGNHSSSRERSDTGHSTTYNPFSPDQSTLDITSPTSEYSMTLASPHSERQDDGLFFATPVQSPSEDGHTPFHLARSSRGVSFYTDTKSEVDLTSARKAPLRESTNTVKGKRKGKGKGGERRQSAIMASLSRLRQDAGIEPDLGRLDEDETEDEYYASDGIRYSFATIDGENLTPRAELHVTRAGRDYGGVI